MSGAAEESLGRVLADTAVAWLRHAAEAPATPHPGLRAARLRAAGLSALWAADAMARAHEAKRLQTLLAVPQAAPAALHRTLRSMLIDAAALLIAHVEEADRASAAADIAVRRVP